MAYYYDSINKYEDMDVAYLSEEEQDELYRPRKMNNRKSLLPLFVYKILQDFEGHHFTQNELLEQLSEYPYEICVERKALSRTIHTLTDSGMGVISSRKDGCWYDSAQVW